MSLAKSSFVVVSLGLLFACSSGTGSAPIGSTQDGVPNNNQPPSGNPNSPPGGGTVPGGGGSGNVGNTGGTGNVGGGDGGTGNVGGGGNLDCTTVCNSKNSECASTVDCSSLCGQLNPSQSQLQCVQSSSCAALSEGDPCGLLGGTGGAGGSGGGTGTCSTADQCASCATCQEFCGCLYPSEYDACVAQACAG